MKNFIMNLLIKYNHFLQEKTPAQRIWFATKLFVWGMITTLAFTFAVTWMYATVYYKGADAALQQHVKGNIIACAFTVRVESSLNSGVATASILFHDTGAGERSPVYVEEGKTAQVLCWNFNGSKKNQ